MSFDFDAAVTAPFRMQPGLRRLAAGAQQLTPTLPGARHQREKLAVLSRFAHQALLQVAGFDAGPALQTLASQAAAEHPQHFAWDGVQARALGVAVQAAGADQGALQALAPGAFGLGDEVGRCLQALPPAWRLAGLLSLVFEEDFAIVDGAAIGAAFVGGALADGVLAKGIRGRIPWLAVCLPSHWAPEQKIGLPFTALHAPVADNALLLKAADSLVALVTGTERWERFVWTITGHPRLCAHPERVDPQRWPDSDDADLIASQAWWRTERQSFIPVPGREQAVFCIHVGLQSLQDTIAPLPGTESRPGVPQAQRAQRIHDALLSMSAEVLAYRGLTAVRAPLLRWLQRQANAQTQAQAQRTP